ncbi:hypothetical protein [Neobacillus jeddahensis]|uniref:hypothetical protein n=1 Tax=Neobacillus jeddahensis TaxID=1461580 RepID=UPI00058E6E87|nr:hypothetical protein [Neobacillus jeddahensis]
MNLTFSNFHNRRFEWAFKAKKEFFNRFIRLDVEKTKLIEEIPQHSQTDFEQLDVNELSFKQLTKFYKEAEEASKLELQQYEEKISQQDTLIERQQFLLEHELEDSELQYKQMCSEIAVFEEFLKMIVLKDTDPDHIRDLVDTIIEYTPYYRKASVLNDDALRLQEIVENELKIKFRKIKQEAGILNLGISNLLELPYLDPISKIEQKIDAFWLKSTYEKATSRIRGNAYEWVSEMYQNYNLLLTPIHENAMEQKEQLVHEAEALKSVMTERKKQLEDELANHQKEKAEHEAHYQKVYQLRNQNREQASQLQGYFMKYWMEYKDELQQHFQNGNAEERWFSAHYLQLLRQDGETIIESLNE